MDVDRVPATDRAPRRTGQLLAPRLVAILGAIVLPGCFDSCGTCVDEKAYGPANFHVSGDCGPPGIITVTRPAGQCGRDVEGAAAVGLPSTLLEGGDGDFPYDEWELSGPVTVPILDGGVTDGGATTTRNVSCNASSAGGRVFQLDCSYYPWGEHRCRAVLTQE